MSLFDLFDDEEETSAPENKNLLDPERGPPMPGAVRSQRFQENLAQASDDSGVKQAQSKAASSQKTANVLQALEGLVRAKGQVYGGQGVNGGFYDGLRTQAMQQVRDAEQTRKERMGQVLQQGELARQTDSDRKADVTWNQQQADRAQKQKLLSDSMDPNSDRSKKLREIYRGMFPDAAKRMDGFDSLAEADLKENFFEPLKLRETIDARREEVRQRSLDRDAAARERGALKAAEKAKKEEEYQSSVKVGDAEVQEGFRPQAKDAETVRKAKASFDAINRQLATLDGLYENAGGTNYVGDTAATQEAIVTDIQLQLKELQNLGVLNGPDLALLMKQVPDPTSLGENLKGTVGMDRYSARSKQFRENLLSRYDSTLGAYGYQRAKQKGSGGGGGGTSGGGRHGSDLP